MGETKNKTIIKYAYSQNTHAHARTTIVEKHEKNNIQREIYSQETKDEKIQVNQTHEEWEKAKRKKTLFLHSVIISLKHLA